MSWLPYFAAGFVSGVASVGATIAACRRPLERKLGEKMAEQLQAQMQAELGSTLAGIQATGGLGELMGALMMREHTAALTDPSSCQHYDDA